MSRPMFFAIVDSDESLAEANRVLSEVGGTIFVRGGNYHYIPPPKGVRYQGETMKDTVFNCHGDLAITGNAPGPSASPQTGESESTGNQSEPGSE